MLPWQMTVALHNELHYYRVKTDSHCKVPSLHQKGVSHTCAENSCILNSSIFRTVCKNSPSCGWNPSTAAAWKMSKMFWALSCIAALLLGFSRRSVAFCTMAAISGALWACQQVFSDMSRITLAELASSCRTHHGSALSRWHPFTAMDISSCHLKGHGPKFFARFSMHNVCTQS